MTLHSLTLGAASEFPGIARCCNKKILNDARWGRRGSNSPRNYRQQLEWWINGMLVIAEQRPTFLNGGAESCRKTAVMIRSQKLGEINREESPDECDARTYLWGKHPDSLISVSLSLTSKTSYVTRRQLFRWRCRGDEGDGLWLNKREWGRGCD